jgi:hypothetical protein
VTIPFVTCEKQPSFFIRVKPQCKILISMLGLDLSHGHEHDSGHRYYN